MTGTKRNARVMAALRLLAVGGSILALAVALTGTVVAFDRDPSLEFGSSLFDAGNNDPRGIWSEGIPWAWPTATTTGEFGVPVAPAKAGVQNVWDEDFRMQTVRLVACKLPGMTGINPPICDCPVPSGCRLGT